jgi:uncharacterized phage-associated protein
MAVSAAAAANTILDAAEERGLALDPMKLQKLVYMTNGYYSALADKAWVKEAFEAWKYGPVIPSLYHKFKSFGSEPIKTGTRINTYDSCNVAADPVLKRVLNFVLDKYGAKSGIYLSDLTHKVGSPWDETRNPSCSSEEISFDSIQRYFKNLVPQKVDA